jgi:UV DNA damage repair endonuclease
MKKMCQNRVPTNLTGGGGKKTRKEISENITARYLEEPNKMKTSLTLKNV